MNKEAAIARLAEALQYFGVEREVAYDMANNFLLDYDPERPDALRGVVARIVVLPASIRKVAIGEMRERIHRLIPYLRFTGCEYQDDLTSALLHAIELYDNMLDADYSNIIERGVVLVAAGALPTQAEQKVWIIDQVAQVLYFNDKEVFFDLDQYKQFVAAMLESTFRPDHYKIVVHHLEELTKEWLDQYQDVNLQHWAVRVVRRHDKALDIVRLSAQVLFQEDVTDWQSFERFLTKHSMKDADFVLKVLGNEIRAHYGGKSQDSIFAERAAQ